ncbi:hypothetical protein BVX94_00560, partial [bacterium B17]
IQTSYILGPSDEIEINIYRNSDLSRSIAINPHGKVDLPLVGEVSAEGKTVSDFKKELVKQYSEYIVNPQLDINLTSAKNNKVYVMGEVQTQGTLILNGTLPIWEAVIQSGGLTDDAHPNKALLIHPYSTNKNEQVEIVATDFTKFNKQDSTISVALNNGDILYIPEKKISSVERFMSRFSNIIAPIVDVQRMIIFQPQVIDALNNEESSSSSLIVAQ